MLGFLRSNSSLNDEDDDDRYAGAGVGDYLEDDDSIEFVPEEEEEDSDSEDFEDYAVDYDHGRRLDPDGRIDHCDYTDPGDEAMYLEEEERDCIDLGMLTSNDSFANHHTSLRRSLYDDLEIDTNEMHDITVASSGLYSDEGLPVDLSEAAAMYQRRRQQQQQQQQQPSKPTSSLMRIVIHAREDIAATFKDPRTFKERKERQKYRLASTMLDDLVANSSDVLQCFHESASNPATDDTHPSSHGSVADQKDLEEATGSNKNGSTKSKFKGQQRQKASKKKETFVHCRCCAHGIIWTFLALSAGILGTYASITSHRSSYFVTLAEPMFVAPIYNEVDGIGLFSLRVCYNETVAKQSGCEVYKLSANDIDDSVFEISRILASLGVLSGGLMTSVLVTSLCWESMNLKPIGLAFLAAYFFQSFAMLFFDTDICAEYKCRMGTGCALCIGAALCWLVACVSVSRMDNFKVRAIRRRKYLARIARRNERELRRRRRKLIHELSLAETSKKLSMSSKSTQWPRAYNNTIKASPEAKRSKYEC
ncbi:hypothetical protein ACA910_001007 [Epithemia clementina (nom. ined.)]